MSNLAAYSKLIFHVIILVLASDQERTISGQLHSVEGGNHSSCNSHGNERSHATIYNDYLVKSTTFNFYSKEPLHPKQ